LTWYYQPQNPCLPADRGFDLTDCDKILRIDSDGNIVLKITDLLTIHKFFGEELI
jgi:hypothetical protein